MKGIEILNTRPGIHFNGGGVAEVILWSPFATNVELFINGHEKIPLQKEAFGNWRVTTKSLKPGDRYYYILNNEKQLPDPASLLQPEGVHGPSEAFNLSFFEWSDKDWINPELSAYIIYELHTGGFTQEGSFQAIENKLDHLKDLGITAIEIMPVAQFPGNRNWGYDGVFPYAVQNSYGGPTGLQHLTDTCHKKGIAVILDVVYNHVGPEGNYLGAFGPYFTEKYKTPWGGAINFDDEWCDGVRNYFIQNALMWLRDFHIDALRLDAVHAIKDFSPTHILKEIKQHVNELTEETGKKYFLIVESDLNDNRYINPIEEKGYGMDAQWIDEFHHALRISAGGEKQGYYSDFNDIEHLAKAYKDAYVYDGQWSPHRKKRFGVKANNNPGYQFVVFSQNHDQVGNRMLGERTSTLVSYEMLKLLAAAVVISPYLPMFFMGEEWGEPHPFLYFVSHSNEDLVHAVRKGRKEEFAAFHTKGEAPDPFSEETFQQSKLQWQLINEKGHATLLNFYKNIISLRKSHPVLSKPDRRNIEVAHEKGKQLIVLKRWNNERTIIAVMNFSKEHKNYHIQDAADKWNKILDSSDNTWGGKGSLSPASLLNRNEYKIDVSPESIVVYESVRESD